MKLIFKMLVLLVVVSCTTTYNLNGSMSKMVIVPDNDVRLVVDANNTPTHTTSNANSSVEQMEKIMQEDFSFIEDETEIMETHTDNSKTVEGDDKSRIKTESDNSEHDTDIDTDIRMKNKGE